MALVLRPTFVPTPRRAAVPARSHGPRRVTEAAGYRSIGSLQALGLAIAASVVATALLWLAA